MDNYIRQWNERGDYLEFAPNSTDAGKTISVEFKSNDGDRSPNAIFTFNKTDLQILIDWAKESMRQLDDPEEDS